MKKIIKKKLNVICIIAARGGSKGLKNKNLQKLNGKPLIYYPITHAIKSKVIDKIIVSTDSLKIAKIAKKYGAEIPFLRPKNLSGDFATTEDTLKHALITYENKTNIKFDIGVFLTSTDIFREIKWIRKAVKLLKNQKSIDSVFSGYETHKNFWEKRGNKWFRIRPWMKVYASRQIRIPIAREDTGIVCAARTFLWRKGKRIGNKVKVLLNNDSFTNIDIHNREDLKLANAAFKIRNEK